MLVTDWFIVGTVVLWVLLDIFLYIRYGNPATESATIWDMSYTFPVFAFSSGCLAGHLFAQPRAPSSVTVTAPLWNQLGCDFLCLGLILWLGYSSWTIIFKKPPSKFDNFVWKITWHQVWLVFLVGFALGSIFLTMDDPTLPG